MIKLRHRFARLIYLAIAVVALALLCACGADDEPAPTPDAPTPPPTPRTAVLTLAGGSSMDLPCGIPFEDPGCTALLPDGEDISAEVQCTGEVDCMTPGSYTLCYSVREGKAEYAKIERLVRVNAVGYPEPEQSGEKVIYLSFDDGPCEYTPMLLENLARHNAKATFFVITGNNPYLDTLLPEIYAAGHSVGVHAQCHEYDVLYSSSAYYLDDLASARRCVYDLTGEYVSLCRFPGGSATAYFKLNNREKGAWDTVTKQLERMGIQYVDWNVGPENAANSGESVVNAVKHFVQKYDTPVVLQHDTRLYSVKSVEAILQWGEENGYTFLGLDTAVPSVHSY